MNELLKQVPSRYHAGERGGPAGPPDGQRGGGCRASPLDDKPVSIAIREVAEGKVELRRYEGVSIRQVTGTAPGACLLLEGKGEESSGGEQVTWHRSRLQAATYAIDKPYDYQVPPELLDSACAPVCGWSSPSGRATAGRRASSWRWRAGTRHDPRRKSMSHRSGRRAGAGRRGPPAGPVDAGALVLHRVRRGPGHAPGGAVLLPSGRWKLAPGVDREAAYEAAGRSEHARRIVELLFASGREADVAQIKEAFGTKDPNPALKLLRDKGILTLETSASRGVGDKTEQVASLAIPPEEALALVTPRRSSAPLRYAVVELLCALGSASAKELCYFTGAANATLRSLEKSGILRLEHREVFRRVTVEAGERAAPPVLNAEQQAAFEGLDALAAVGRPAAALLYGVTGSGKTQVYLRFIYEALDRGRTAMVLVPEIALTPQLLRIFASHFGDDIAVLHSSLRAGERYDEWKRVRSGQARVVIGTRSAVFAPLRNLGLLILDEEQESTYKSENVPKYHARDVAKYRCAQNDALLVLGSATPSVESMYHAKRGDYHLFTLRRRYNEQALPEVLIADMKEELRAGNGTSLSGPLRAGLAAAWSAGEQSILFLNRRGASRMVTCGECGEVPTCPRCSVYLTYHSANGRLMCHYCGHSEPLPDACPSCGGALNFLGYGTQKVEEELHAAVSGAGDPADGHRHRLRHPDPTRSCSPGLRRRGFPCWWAPRWWPRGWILRMSPWWG